jgi:repressor LexA
MYEISKRIFDLMETLKLSYGELAQKTGLYKSALQRYATGTTEKIPLDAIEKIAPALGCSAAYLIGWDAKVEEANAAPFISRKEDSKFYREIPILGRVSAGLPLLAEQNLEGYAEIGGLKPCTSYFGLRVKGDSMDAAHVPNGAIAVIRQQKQVNNGEIAVVLVDGLDATLKVFRQEGETIMLLPRSTNPQHTPQIYNVRDMRVAVLGKLAQVVIEEAYII